MGLWKDHVLGVYEQLGCDPECANLDDDQLWALAEERARERLAARSDHYRDRAKEAR